MMMQMPVDQQGQQLILQPALIQFAHPQHPQPMLVRQRPNAVSIRNRRRRDLDTRNSLHNVDSEKSVVQQTPRRSRAQRFSTEFSSRPEMVTEPPQHSSSKSEERNLGRRDQKMNREWRRQRAYSDEWDRAGGGGGDEDATAGFIFVHTILSPKKEMFTFSQANSHASTIATRGHEYFQEEDS